MNNELYHYGVLGMKWGVRRTPTQLGRTSERTRKRSAEDYHEDYKRAHRKKSAKYMSDAELRSRINRLNMENSYARLTEKRSLISKGKTIAIKTISATATAAASAYVSKYANTGAKIVKEMFIKPAFDNVYREARNFGGAAFLSKELLKNIK